MLIATEEQLEDCLSTPNNADIEAMRRIEGDIIVLGAGGKMGPSLARLARRAADAAQNNCRVYAASRFSNWHERALLDAAGVETIVCDLLDPEAVAALPDCPNVLYLAGRKFGSADRSDLTWASNVVVPSLVGHRYRASRIVAFSTGNVYPFVPAYTGGAVENDPLNPRGEYAQSCLGRERIFEYYSRDHGTKVVLFRLNYAVDLRYGTLVDIARKVFDSVPIDLSVGHFNTIWQGDANSYALRSLEYCESPARVLNVTGPDVVSVLETAKFYANRFGRYVKFTSSDCGMALLNNASLCHRLMGRPQMPLQEIMELVAYWIESGGRSLGKPTKFERIDGKF